MLSLILHEIRSRWTPILGWGLGISAYGGLYTSLFPQIEEQMAGLADLAIYDAMGISMGSFEGYLASTAIGFVSILLGIYAVMAGTGILAGEEDSGTLEMLLATRLPRWQIVTAKAAGLTVVTLLIVLIVATSDALVFSSIADQVTTSATAADVFVVVLSAWPLILALSMIALFLGALLPSRRSALMAATLVYIASYFGENLAGMLTSLEWLRPFSIFSYFNNTASVFTEGVALGDVTVLFLVALTFLALAIVAFERRNVTVGAWPWQRARVGAGAS